LRREALGRLTPVFRIGGVLVGSHAFAELGNMLGVRWQEAMVRTQDVDIAHDHRIAVALARDAEPADLPRVPGDIVPRFAVLNPTDPATSFRVRGTDVEVELLTPLVGRERTSDPHRAARCRRDTAAVPRLPHRRDSARGASLLPEGGVVHRGDPEGRRRGLP
jgi:hypothetical protein